MTENPFALFLAVVIFGSASLGIFDSSCNAELQDTTVCKFYKQQVAQ